MKKLVGFAVLVLTLTLPGLGQVPVMLPAFGIGEPSVGGPGSVSAHAEGAAMSPDGTFVVTWLREGDLFGTLSRWPGSQYPLGPTSESSVARDASGRSIVVWSDGGHIIRGRRFDANWTPLGESFLVTASGLVVVSSPHVASDPSGNFVATWTSSPGGDVVARGFDSHGEPLGYEFAVNLFTPGAQSASGVAMSPAGFVVTWSGSGPSGLGVFGRRFDPSGTPVTGDLQINIAAPAFPGPGAPDVAMNAAGGFVVVWKDGSALLGRRFDADGPPLGDVFTISAPATAPDNPEVASDAAGNFLVVWNDTDTVAGFDISGRYFDATGATLGAEFDVADYPPYEWNWFSAGYDPHPALADDGSFVVAWTGAGGYPNYTCCVSASAVGLRSGVRALGVWIPTGNGVLEPGESVVVGTAWNNDSSANVPMAGTASAFSGPPGATYTVGDATADYGSIPAGQGRNCSASGDCYGVTVSAPAVRPARHWDARLQEALTVGVPKTWKLHIGESFPDVPADNLFYKSIETLFHNGVTAGCFGGGYCPEDPVTRAQMAVFLLKSRYGVAHVPPPCTGTVFTDVPCEGSPYDPWIEELVGLGITAGCGENVGESVLNQPQIVFCPNDTVTREQMAVLLLKTREGSTYAPPACTGVFDDVPCTPGTGFSDWIEELYERGITGGCNAAPALYCPTNPNNRGQMAAFLTKTFYLVLYGGR
jgi:hypothetical protein